jgi:hypothetical protein
LAEWTEIFDTLMNYLEETHSGSKNMNRLRVKGWKKILQANSKQKRAGVVILVFYKIDFKKFFQTGCHYVAETGLKFLGSRDSSASIP